MIIMDLHELASEDRHKELSEALAQNDDLIDSYLLSKDFHTVINRHDLKGTPLHFAIIHNSINCVKILLEHGADVNKCVRQCERGEQDIPHANALFLAKKLGYEEICELLEKCA
jgi:ankyrin repeat protein